MRPISIALGLLFAFTGCSLVFDPGVHTSGGMDGGDTDGGDPDGGGDAGMTDGSTADGGDDAGPPGIDLADLCPMLADAYCTNAERCCMESVTPRPAFDRTMCLNDSNTQCSAIYGLTSTRSEIGYDRVAALAALERGVALLEDCDVGVQDFYVQRDGFFGGITGTIAGGLDCTPVNETNETDVIVAVLSCTGGQVCQQIAPRDWRCSTPGADGASCSQAFDCMSGRCVQDGIFAPRLCGPGEPAMSPCARAVECQSLTCTHVPMTVRFECAPQTQDNVYCTYLMTGDAG